VSHWLHAIVANVWLLRAFMTNDGLQCTSINEENVHIYLNIDYNVRHCVFRVFIKTKLQKYTWESLVVEVRGRRLHLHLQYRGQEVKRSVWFVLCIPCRPSAAPGPRGPTEHSGPCRTSAVRSSWRTLWPAGDTTTTTTTTETRDNNWSMSQCAY